MEKETSEKKCPACGKVTLFKDFTKNKNNKNGFGGYCKKCFNEKITKRRNTERGYLKLRYDSMTANKSSPRSYGRKSKCHCTVDEFFAVFDKHKSIYGMKSAWGPGINNLEQHLPMTMIQHGKGQIGKKGGGKGAKLVRSNLSVDRLDSNRDYTIQNIIFIRGDENGRKNSSSYEDCKIQIRLHEERFINMEAI